MRRVLTRLPRPIVAILVALSIVGVLQAGPALAPAGSPLAPQTASAQTYLDIYNSINSVGPIEVYSAIHPGGVTITPGNHNTFYNGDSSVVVDPDPELGPDVGSTWWGLQGEGLTHCVQGEPEINPPDNTSGKYIKYNTDKSGC